MSFYSWIIVSNDQNQWLLIQLMILRVFVKYLFFSGFFLWLKLVLFNLCYISINICPRYDLISRLIDIPNVHSNPAAINPRYLDWRNIYFTSEKRVISLEGICSNLLAQIKSFWWNSSWHLLNSKTDKEDIVLLFSVGDKRIKRWLNVYSTNSVVVNVRTVIFPENKGK